MQLFESVENGNSSESGGCLASGAWLRVLADVDDLQRVDARLMAGRGPSAVLVWLCDERGLDESLQGRRVESGKVSIMIRCLDDTINIDHTEIKAD